MKLLPPTQASHDIVLGLIRQFPPAVPWLDKYRLSRGYLGPVETHHIMGRGKRQSEWQCNKIGIYDAVHDWNHDVGKCAVELCALRAQWLMQVKHDEWCKLNGQASQHGDKKYWNVAAMGALCPYSTLAGRIEVKLLPIVRGTDLEAVAEELMEVCRADDCPY